MIQEVTISIAPKNVNSPLTIMKHIREELALKKTQRIQFEILKKSIDARRQLVTFTLKLRVYIDEQPIPKQVILYIENNVADKEEVVIIGAGPAGLFCALQCIELGLKPVVFERGKNVRDRRRDLAQLNKEGILDEESNYCFGEGGAGTYSDGKLYTRSNKRGDIQRVLDLFHLFGADENITYEAHPHIGTNKLPQIIQAMREKIIACGGEVHFSKKLTDFKIVDDKIVSITLNENEQKDIKQLVLATGHSAKDIYELLFLKKVEIESKPLAIGVRVEHPQHLIDNIQYHCTMKDENLPPASYSLVEQVNGRGVFSFCMCPGGIIAPASTQKDTLVVNGWSPSKRNNPFANSGIVVSVNPEDFKDKSVLGGLRFQESIEKKAFEVGGGKYIAPAQRMTDFTQNRLSSFMPECSYIPGVNSSLLSEVLPNKIYDSLSKAFVEFGKKMKGYYTEEALVVATESRTSSPVRIPRDKETLQHIRIQNLYPCAEGAGYAGGIVSAAMDGMKIAEKIGEN
jgi:uncharacterized FAD-dependent dehydrogenase